MRKERRRKRKLNQTSCLNVSILNPAWIPCSLRRSFFRSKTNLTLMEIGEWYGMGVGCPLRCPDTSTFKGKTRKNARENEEARRKMEQPTQHRDARPCVVGGTACASHHGPWWAPQSARGELCPSWSVGFFNAAFCALLVL